MPTASFSRRLPAAPARPRHQLVQGGAVDVFGDDEQGVLVELGVDDRRGTERADTSAATARRKCRVKRSSAARWALMTYELRGVAFDCEASAHPAGADAGPAGSVRAADRAAAGSVGAPRRKPARTQHTARTGWPEDLTDPAPACCGRQDQAVRPLMPPRSLPL